MEASLQQPLDEDRNVSELAERHHRRYVQDRQGAPDLRTSSAATPEQLMAWAGGNVGRASPPKPSSTTCICIDFCIATRSSAIRPRSSAGPQLMPGGSSGAAWRQQRERGQIPTLRGFPRGSAGIKIQLGDSMTPRHVATKPLATKRSPPSRSRRFPRQMPSLPASSPRPSVPRPDGERSPRTAQVPTFTCRNLAHNYAWRWFGPC